MRIDDNKLKRAFVEETEELLEKLNVALLSLEADRGNIDLVNEVFRLTHSLKSESALMEFSNLSKVAHGLEDVFEKIRSNELVLSRQIMDMIFAGFDVMHEMLNRISLGGDDSCFNIDSVLRELEPLLAKPHSPLQTREVLRDKSGPVDKDIVTCLADIEFTDFEKGQIREAWERGEAIYTLTFRIADDEPMKYPRAYLVFNNLELIANVIRTCPDMVNPEASEESFSLITLLLCSDKERKQLIAAVDIDQIKDIKLIPLIYEDLLKAEHAEHAAHGFETGRIKHPGSSDFASPGKRERISIRVETRKLNDLWRLVGELIMSKSHLSRVYERIDNHSDPVKVKSQLEVISDSLDRISTGMQESMIETRMVPISVIFNKFPRLVRDLSSKLGKSVTIEIHGQDTEIDRSIVEALADPFTHIIRNALDHGIEFSEERLKQGKAEQGKISISALQQGGKVVIEISDDGRGLDLEKIRQKAGEKGVLKDEDVVDFIFTPGFSTKESVTDLSGRGVGMDVVATRIREELKGEVKVRSVQGKGTAFTIMLPLALNILNSLIVRCDGYFYAIPTQNVDETVKVLLSDIIVNGDKSSYSYREQIIPLAHLSELFDRKPQPADESYGVILNHREEKACLLVDELVEEEELVIKPIDSLVNYQHRLSGVSVLGDGTIVYVLDTSIVEELACV
jgi:two-component system chemotaxis sensor kinase CheA